MFLFSLWSGKESQWSKWESSFSTLKVVERETRRRDIFFYQSFYQTEQNINNKNKKITRWAADWGPGWAKKTSRARRMEEHLCCRCFANCDRVVFAKSDQLFLQGAPTLLRLPCRRRVRKSPHSPAEQTETRASHNTEKTTTHLLSHIQSSCAA